MDCVSNIKIYDWCDEVDKSSTGEITSGIDGAKVLCKTIPTPVTKRHLRALSLLVREG